MFKTRNLAVAIGAALALGTATQASAAPVFTIDPTVISGTGAQFDATLITGASSARITSLGGGIYDSNGWITFSGFSNDGAPVGAGVHGATVDYGLYATFSQTFNCGGALGVGVTCAVTGLTLDVYADPGFTNAYNISTLLANATVTDNGAADIHLATSNIVFSGVAGLNALGGAFENVAANFILIDNPVGTDGEDYFFAPNPFYEIAFAAFNNTSQGIQCNTVACDDIVAINQENGIIDFNRVPEPTTLALLGLAFVGLGASSRRKAQK